MSKYFSMPELFSKWLASDVPPELSDIVISKNKNAMAWRWLFFYKCRVMTMDVNKIFFPSNAGRPAVARFDLIKSFDTDSIIVLSFNHILN